MCCIFFIIFLISFFYYSMFSYTCILWRSSKNLEADSITIQSYYGWFGDWWGTVVSYLVHVAR